VDCSGSVTALDATALLRYSTLRPYTQKEPCPDIGTSIGRIWGDVDCNRQANSLDGVKVLRHMFGQPVTQFEPCPDIGTPFR
jgi:hypothetical protein